MGRSCGTSDLLNKIYFTNRHLVLLIKILKNTHKVSEVHPMIYQSKFLHLLGTLICMGT